MDVVACYQMCTKVYFFLAEAKIEYETYLRVDNILFAILLWFIHYYSHDIIIIIYAANEAALCDALCV